MNCKKNALAVIFCAMVLSSATFEVDAQDYTWEQFEKEFIHPDLRNIPLGNIDPDYRGYVKAIKTKPEVTSSTIRVVLDDLSQLEFDDFHDGVAFVKTYHDGAFYIDKNGKKLFKTECKSIGNELPHFDNGVVMEHNGNEASIRDKTGKVIKSFKVQSVSNFNNGIASVVIPEFIQVPARNGVNDKTIYHYRIINTKGEFIYPHLWQTLDFPAYNITNNNDITRMKHFEGRIMPSTEGISAFAKYNSTKRDWEWGFFETATGKVILEPTYSFVRPFKDGMAAVRVEEGRKVHRWGFVNSSGKLVIPLKYSQMPTDFSDGYARVLNKKEEAFLIDKTGAIVKGPYRSTFYEDEATAKTAEGEYISPFNNGYAILGEYIDLKAIDHFEGGRKLVYYVIDKNFNKLAWANLHEISGTVCSYYDIHGRQSEKYQCTDDLIIDNFRLDPKTLNILSTCVQKPYIDGLSRYNEKVVDVPIGYIDRDNKYVIIFEETEF